MSIPINPSIFKAYDIRGVYGVDFDEELAYKLALAFASMRRKELKRENITLVVGHDMRVSSPVLHKALIEGLLDAGVRVIDIGLASTPTFYFTVAFYQYDGGILVSASHNPKEYNGFKLVRDRAMALSNKTGILELRDMILSHELSKAPMRGNLEKKNDVLTEQVAHDMEYVSLEKTRPMKIVIDTANAMGALYFDALFQKISGEIIRMNWELDGTFPAHEADPFKEENVKELGKRVREEKADLGIATDGDGDRIFFVDEKGVPIPASVTRAILSKIVLEKHPGSKIVYDIRPGKITPDTILAHGGIPVVEKVGHSFLKEKVLEENAIFAGESSGHFFLSMKDGCYEIPLIVTMLFLAEISESGLSVSEYVKPYLRYAHSGEINTRVSDPQEKIAMIKEKYRDGKHNELDGLTVEYPDFWFNLRKSNTEPLLRFTLEAISEEIMEQKRDEILEIIRS